MPTIFQIHNYLKTTFINWHVAGEYRKYPISINFSLKTLHLVPSCMSPTVKLLDLIIVWRYQSGNYLLAGSNLNVRTTDSIKISWQIYLYIAISWKYFIIKFKDHLLKYIDVIGLMGVVNVMYCQGSILLDCLKGQL
jgi:hypothetical protein